MLNRPVPTVCRDGARSQLPLNPETPKPRLSHSLQEVLPTTWTETSRGKGTVRNSFISLRILQRRWRMQATQIYPCRVMFHTQDETNSLLSTKVELWGYTLVTYMGVLLLCAWCRQHLKDSLEILRTLSRDPERCEARASLPAPDGSSERLAEPPPRLNTPRLLQRLQKSLQC